MAQRTWLITGVSSGFGRHLTEQLLERGDRVVGTVRRPDKVADLADAHPDLLRGRGARRARHRGLRERSSIAPSPTSAASTSWSATPATACSAPPRNSPTNRSRHIIATNLTGSIQLIRAVLPHMRGQGGGPHHPALQLRRPGRLPRQLALPRHQVGHRGLLRGGRPGGRAVRHRRDHRRARRRAHRVPLRQRPGRRPHARIRRNPGARLPGMLDPANGLAPGDPARMAARIIDSVDQNPPRCGSCSARRPSNPPSTRSASGSPTSRRQTELAASTDFPSGE